MRRVLILALILLVGSNFVQSKSATHTHIPVVNFNLNDEYFSGRSKELAQIKVQLGANHLLQINGISGIGKTALAAAFARLNKSQYDVIWWINGRTELVSQCAQFLKLLEKKFGLQVPDSVMQASADGVFAYIQEHFKGQSILIIVDDVKGLDGSLKRLVHAKGNEEIDIIITTQAKLPEIPELSLDSFSAAESKELISSFFPDASPHHVTLLADKLHHFPIALAQALRYAKFHGYDIATYLRNLETDRKSLITEEAKFIHKHKEHLVQWDSKHEAADLVLIKYMQDAVAKDKNLEQVLYILPFLAQQFVSKSFLNGYLQFNNQAGGSSQDLYTKLLATGLLMPAATGDGFHYHEITKHITPSEDKVRKHAEQVGQYLLSLIEGQEASNFPADENGKREYIDHTQAYLDMCEIMDIVTPDVLRLRILMSYYHYSVSRSKKSCIKQIRLVPTNHKAYEAIPRYYQVLYSAMGAYVASDLKTAEEFYKQFSPHLDFVINDSQCAPMSLRLLSMITYVLAELPKLGSAEQYIKLGEAKLKESKNTFQNLAFASAEAWYLNSIGKYHESESFIRRVWPLIADSTFKVHITMNRTLALLKLNKLKEAEKFAQLALGETSSYFGNRIVDVKAEALAMLGNVCLHKRDYETAAQLLDRSLALFTQLRQAEGGNVGRDTRHAKAKFSLAQCLLGLGLATESLEKAYEVEHDFSHLTGEGAETEFAKQVYIHIIKAAWLAKQSGISGRYMARYERRFGESIPQNLLPDINDTKK